MTWFFWRKNRRSSEQILLASMQQQLAAIDHQLKENSQQLAFIAENTTTGNEQTLKWSRSQYKSAQETLFRLDKLEQLLISIQQQNEEQSRIKARMDQLEEQLNRISASLIQWLDDIDHLLMKLPEHENDGWKAMLRQWADQLIAALKVLDIHEMDLLHRSFDPRFAESICSIPIEAMDRQPDIANLVPFQVVSVIRRGFIRGKDTILRKAQVTTLQFDGGEK